MQRAFYGDREHPWDYNRGIDVTEAVKTVLDAGLPLKAQNTIFGDSVPGCEKMLIIESTAPACPVSSDVAEGFVTALRAQYIDNPRTKHALSKFFEKNGIPKFQRYALKSIVKMFWGRVKYIPHLQMLAEDREQALAELSIYLGL